MHVDHPFHFDARGRTAEAGHAEHVRDMIEQVLFTDPGERVNRPDFGSGLRQLVFDPNSPELAEAVQFTVQAALQQWLGDLIDVSRLEASVRESTLRLVIEYVLRPSGERRTESFERSV